MNLALNSQLRLISHKTQANEQISQTVDIIFLTEIIDVYSL